MSALAPLERPWAPSAVAIFHAARVPPAQRAAVKQAAQEIAVKDGAAWIINWIVRAALDGRTAADTFDKMRYVRPEDYGRRGEPAAREGRERTPPPTESRLL